MPDIRIVVTRESISDQWPAEQSPDTQAYALSSVTAAQNGEHNCEMSFILGEDGLSKEISYEFPTTADRDAFFAATTDAEMEAKLKARNDDSDNPVTYWSGNAEDYPG